MDVQHTHTHCWHTLSRPPSRAGWRFESAKGKRELAFMIRATWSCQHEYIWMARTYTYTHRLVLSTSLSLSILIHEVERYIRFIHNDPWAKSSSSSGAVYQWKWAKRKKENLCVCVGIFWLYDVKRRSPQRPLPGKKKKQQRRNFQMKTPKSNSLFFFYSMARL